MRRARPKPNLVSMWMLDVFCCALGCVTLLWLLNTRLAGDEAKKVAAAVADLTHTKNALLATRDDADATRKLLTTEIDTLKAKLLASTTEKTELAARLAAANTEVATLGAKLAKSEADVLQNSAELARKQADLKDMIKKLASSAASIDDLQKLLRKQETDAATLMAKVKATEAKIVDVDARVLALTQERDKATANLAEMKKTGDELAQSKASLREMQKKLDDSNASIIDLQGDKAKLADKIDKLRIESESRFAGIALTGKRVVFVVDTSGSMKLLDDKNPAPNKWPLVAETVAKVMRSLPELEQYQVITFAKAARPLFSDRDWRTWRGEATATEVKTALLAIDPQGDTNLYDAFDQAFRLKTDGLDTIYLFSDGLPTNGPGLTVEQDKAMTDGQRIDFFTKQMRTTLKGVWNPADRRRVRINSIGFFFESPEVGAFLWALSRENDGSFVGMSKP
jgi:seryl-tRNA synthetase